MKRKLIILLFGVFISGIIFDYIIINYLFDLPYNNKNSTIETDRELIIPNEKSLIHIAQSMWEPKYGRNSFRWCAYSINIDQNGIWVVEGVNLFSKMFSINSGGPYLRIDGYSGLVYEISLSK